jgi:hypothetical protein
LEFVLIPYFIFSTFLFQGGISTYYFPFFLKIPYTLLQCALVFDFCCCDAYLRERFILIQGRKDLLWLTDAEISVHNSWSLVRQNIIEVGTCGRGHQSPQGEQEAERETGKSRERHSPQGPAPH